MTDRSGDLDLLGLRVPPEALPSLRAHPSFVGRGLGAETTEMVFPEDMVRRVVQEELAELTLSGDDLREIVKGEVGELKRVLLTVLFRRDREGRADVSEGDEK